MTRSSLPDWMMRPRITLSIAALLALTGLAAWFTMPRLEDPEMSDRWASVIATYPGADPETIERTVLEPIEEELAQVSGLKRIDSTARAGFAVITLEVSDNVDVKSIDKIWTRVDEKLKDAHQEFPRGAGEPTLDRDVSDPEAIVLAVTGAEYEQLAQAAQRVERALLGLGKVARVKRIGDPGQEVVIEIDPAVAAHVGVNLRTLTSTLASRHTTIPAGSIELDGRTASLRPEAEFASAEEISRTPIPLANGSAIALGDVASVRIGPSDPAGERMRFNRQAAIGLGIIPQRPVDLVKFGVDVRAEIKRLERELAPLKIEEVAFQPDQVEARLNDLGSNLIQSMLIVGAVLMLMMGLRMGLVLSAVVPLVTLASLGVYAAFGGVLHQMSIAALVISIGMFVDNAIVVAEDVQARLDAGTSKQDAMRQAVTSLALPLGSANGTTIAAFVPMLMAQGPVAEFTGALPVVIALTLVMSYVFTLFVTPVLTTALKPSTSKRDDWMMHLGQRLGTLAVTRKKAVFGGALLAMFASLMAAPYVEQNFFPHGDRNQLIVDLSLPEGASVTRVDALSLELERALESRTEVASVTSFIGRGAPHFYYNLTGWPKSPHRAQLLVTTRDLESVDAVQAFIRGFARRELPELAVAVKKLEQGPSVAAPIEVRVYGPHLSRIAQATDLVLREVTNVEGTVDILETLGTGVPAVKVRIDSATAARHHTSSTDVVLALLSETRGLEVGQLRTTRDPVPILVRAPLGRHLPPELLDSVGIGSGGSGKVASDVPLAEIADTQTQWLPAAIHHRNRKRVAKVLAELAPDATFSSVMRQLQPKLDALELPDGVTLEIGGAGEGSTAANDALLMAMPLGVLLLLALLLAEFNSFRRVAIVLTTIPLAAIGVIPGLLLAQQPFGFMSVLGVTGLAGIVVNNAIILLDLADRKLAEGVSIEEATREAVRARTRPILLTAATTVVGLLPLALSNTSLWPPLAWAMISGLTASTLLTLLVVPALYVLLMQRKKPGLVPAAE